MNTKMVIIIRKDLKCRTGKWIVQGGHSSLAFMKRKIEKLYDYGGDFYSLFNDVETDWLFGIQKKICLQVDSEQELRLLDEQAKKLGIESNLIQDLGLTEFDGLTTTAVVIGPDLEEKIDPITKHLKLY